MSVATTYENYSADWWTPEPWYRWAEDLLGHMVDPCIRGYLPDYHDNGLTVDWCVLDDTTGVETGYYVNHPGGRGQASRWWDKALSETGYSSEGYWELELIWCAFNIEQLRTLDPSPLDLPGYIVYPHRRLKFVWGGPTGLYGKNKKAPRVHGEPCKSPSNWAVFWSTVRPRWLPEPAWVFPTGTVAQIGPLPASQSSSPRTG